MSEKSLGKVVYDGDVDGLDVLRAVARETIQSQ